MTATAIQPRAAVTAEQIEALLIEHDAAKLALEKAKEEFDAVRAEIQELVEQFGSAAGKKSKRLDGTNHYANVSYGQTVEIEQTAVDGLRLFLKAKNKSALFRKLFAEDTRYRQQKNAERLVEAAIESAPRNTLGRLREIFDGCFRLKDKKPTLSVEVREPESKE